MKKTTISTYSIFKFITPRAKTQIENTFEQNLEKLFYGVVGPHWLVI